MEKSKISELIIFKLEKIEHVMRYYLLGEKKLSKLINNHIIFFSHDSSSIVLKGVGGYTLWKNNAVAIIVNLAGILCVTHIQLDEQDIWENTEIIPRAGEFKFPQRVSSWIVDDFQRYLYEVNEGMSMMSKKQYDVIINRMSKKKLSALSTKR